MREQEGDMILLYIRDSHSSTHTIPKLAYVRAVLSSDSVALRPEFLALPQM